MQIYIHRQGQQLGPFTEAEVRAQIASGTVSLADHAWWEGQPNWIPLAQAPWMAVAPSVPPLPPVAPAAYGYPPAGPATSTFAVASLVCGLLSLLCCLFTSIPAIILGHLGLGETRRNPALQGRGMAWAGLVIGYLMTGLFLICLIPVLVLMSLGYQFQDTLKKLEAQVQAAQAGDSPDSSSTDSSTNAPDSSTNAVPAVNP